MRLRLVRVLMLFLAAAIVVPMVSGESLRAAAVQKQRKKSAKKKKAGKRKKAGKKKNVRKRKKAGKKKAAKRRRKRPAGKKKKRPMRRKPAKKVAKKVARPKAATGKAAPKTVGTQLHDWKGAQKLIAKHKGKVVVVDFWATWCKPCVKELPELVALQKRFPKDVVAISFCADYDGDENIKRNVVPRVLKVLKRLKAINVINVVSTQSDEQIYETVGIDSVPTIFVYGRDGKLAKKIDVNSANGDVSYAKHVIPLVKKLIAEKGGK